jgi:23S rRNA (uracil1939-C5)-methyltransferase
MAGQLLLYVKKVIEKYDLKDAKLLDLFGGVGLFGVSLGDAFRETLVIESHAESVRLADENLKANAVNGKALCLDAAKLGTIDRSFDVVITDPPRSGMSMKAISWLLASEPKVIIYVSCNPDQLHRELRHFSSKYMISSVAIVDLFPQTNHVETVVELKKRE